MNPQGLLEYLFDIVPEFKASWLSEENCNNSYEGYSFSGICAEFSTYFINQEKHKYITRHEIKWHKSISDIELKLLFEFFEHKVVEAEALNLVHENTKLLSAAILTCFFENISQTNAGEYSKSYMGEKCRACFNKWHAYEKRL